MLLRFLINISEPFRALVLIIIRPFIKSRYIDSLPVEGNSVLLVCNGPSLNQVDLSKFSGIQGYGLNKINLIFTRTKWKPSGIFVINGLVISQIKDLINMSSDIPYYCDEKGIFLGARATKYIRFGANRMGEP